MAKASGSDISPAQTFSGGEALWKPVISTGQDTLDLAIGPGGVPTGRAIILNGPHSCGKTTLAIDLIRNAQKRGGVGVFFDFEAKLSLDYFESLGLDMEAFVYLTPPYIEEALRQIEGMIADLRKADADAPCVFVWDSISSAKCKAVYDGKWTDHNFAGESRVYSDKLPKLCQIIAKTGAILVGISQKRVSMAGGVVTNKLASGNAWIHHASIAVVWKSKKVKKALLKGGLVEEVVWDVELVKNQCGNPFTKTQVKIVFGHGYDSMWSTVAAGIESGVITKAGTWLSFGEESLGQGVDNAADHLTAHPALYDALRATLRAECKPLAGYPPSEEEDDE